jgi:hypothetical protein
MSHSMLQSIHFIVDWNNFTIATSKWNQIKLSGILSEQGCMASASGILEWIRLVCNFSCFSI